MSYPPQGNYNGDPDDMYGSYLADNYGIKGSAGNDYSGQGQYDPASAYDGNTSGNSYAGGTNGSAYGGWVASNPLSGNNAFSGNQGSLGYGPNMAPGYNPQMGMGHYPGGNNTSGWNLGSVGVDSGDGSSSVTNANAGADSNQDIKRFMSGQAPSMQAPPSFQQPPQDSSNSGDTLLRGTNGGINAYQGGQQYSTNDEGYQPASNTQGMYNDKMASMQNYMQSHGVNFTGNPQTDYGAGGSAGNSIGSALSGASQLPQNGQELGNALHSTNLNGQSDWTEDGQAPMPPHLANADMSQPQFNPNAPTATPFGGLQQPNSSQYAGDYQQNQKTLSKLGINSLDDYANYRNSPQSQSRNVPSNQTPATPGTPNNPTNNPANWQGSQYSGPSGFGVQSSAPQQAGASPQGVPAAKPLQMSSLFGGQQAPQVASALGNENIFNQEAAAAQAPKASPNSQADPVLDGLLQQLQTTHDPATINKIMQMIKPSGSSNQGLT